MIGDATAEYLRAARRLGRSPGFAVVALLSLAVSLSITLGVGSVAFQLLLAPLPYPDADRIVRLGEAVSRDPGNLVTVSYPNAIDWRERGRDVLEVVSLSRPFQTATWLVEGDAALVHVTFVDAEHLALFGVPMVAGRRLTGVEAAPGSDAPVALVSGRFADRAFGTPDQAVGRDLDLDGRRIRVVGVVDPDFSDVASAFEATDVWLPLGSPLAGLPTEYESNRSGRYFRVHALTAAGVTTETAHAALERLGASLEREYPETNHRYGIGMRALRDDLVGDVRTPLLALSVGALFLLFTGLANYASLQTGRLHRRRNELLLRRALGASRADLSRLVQREGVLLIGAACCVSVAAAPGMLALTRRTEVLAVPSFMNLAMDWHLAGGLVVAVSAVAWWMGRIALRHTIPAADRPASFLRDRGASRSTPRGLLMLQIGLATAVAVVALALVASSRNLARADSGLTVDRQVAVSVTLPTSRYPDPDAARRFVSSLADAVDGEPSIEAAVWSPGVPGYSGSRTTLVREGETVTSQLDALVVRYHNVSPGALELVGIDIVRGRTLSAADGPNEIPVAVISEALAERLWPGESPLGRRIQNYAAPGSPFDGPLNPWVEVVGVATDARHSGIRSEILPAPMDVYYPHAQRFRSLHTLTIVAAGPDGVPGTIREMLHDLDPGLPIAESTLLARYTSFEGRIPDFAAGVLGFLAVVSVTLAGIGLYAAQSEAVATRRTDLAVRRAVGASASAVGWSVLRSMMGVALVALVAGGMAAAAALRLAERMLYGVEALSPSLYVGAGAALAIALALATGGPLLRALRVEPSDALKAQSGT